MTIVGKFLNSRRRGSVKKTLPKLTLTTIATKPSPQQIAEYLAGMTQELVAMAQAANLPFVGHLLAMAQAEAAYATESET